MGKAAKVIGVIPARYGSTRFPGKPLVEIRGKSMIQRVYERASTCQALSELWVATDDARIFDHVQQFGGKVKMTRLDHSSGTERVAEVAETLEGAYFLNIQGDEPLIRTHQIAQVVETLLAGAAIATLIYPSSDSQRLADPNAVKVVFNHRQEALYFSRAPIPFRRDATSEAVEGWLHMGLYGYAKAALEQLVRLPPHPLEQREQLEQLRWLGYGHTIICTKTDSPGHSVDRPEDLARIEAELDRLRE